MRVRATYHRQQGMVLIATLAFITVILLAAGYFATKVDKARQWAAQAQVRADGALKLHDGMQRLLYRVAVTNNSLYGIGPDGAHSIRLDDRPYRLSSGIIVRLQDQRGLMSLRYVDRLRLGRHLALLNIPVERRSALFDTLEDFIDSNRLKHINGAEQADYAAAGLPPPADRPLYTIDELQRVMGWRNIEPLWGVERLADLFTVSGATGINPNAAPWQVLATLPGVDEPIARKLVRFRQLQPVTQAVLSKITLMTTERMQFLVFPSPSPWLRMTANCDCGLPSIRYNVRLMPMSDVAPWVMESIDSLPVKPVMAGQQPQPLPEAIEVRTIQAGPFSP